MWALGWVIATASSAAFKTGRAGEMRQHGEGVRRRDEAVAEESAEAQQTTTERT
jgi:hypothetical protein